MDKNGELALMHTPFIVLIILNILLLVYFTVQQYKYMKQNAANETQKKTLYNLFILAFIVIFSNLFTMAYMSIHWSIISHSDTHKMSNEITLLLIYSSPVFGAASQTSLITFYLLRLITCFNGSIFAVSNRGKKYYYICIGLFISSYIAAVIVERLFGDYTVYGIAIMWGTLISIHIFCIFCSKLLKLLLLLREYESNNCNNSPYGIRNYDYNKQTQLHNIQSSTDGDINISKTNTVSITVESVSNNINKNKNKQCEEIKFSNEEKQLIEVATQQSVLITWAAFITFLSSIAMIIYGFDNYFICLALDIAVFNLHVSVVLSFAQFDSKYNKLFKICHGQFKQVCTNFALKKIMIEQSLKAIGSRNGRNSRHSRNSKNSENETIHLDR